MHPWIAGRLVEAMQHDYRALGDQARLGRLATSRSHDLHYPEIGEPRRARVGLAVARLGLRIAGRDSEPLAVRPTFGAPNLEANLWSNPWTTCGATSTSKH